MLSSYPLITLPNPTPIRANPLFVQHHAHRTSSSSTHAYRCTQKIMKDGENTQKKPLQATTSNSVGKKKVHLLKLGSTIPLALLLSKETPTVKSAFLSRISHQKSTQCPALPLPSLLRLFRVDQPINDECKQHSVKNKKGSLIMFVWPYAVLR